MKLIYKTQGGTTYKFVYTTINRNIYSKKIGKYFTTITQCLLYKNDLVIGFSTAQRCFTDKQDKRYAHILVTRKLIHLIQTKRSRTNIFKMLFDKFI